MDGGRVVEPPASPDWATIGEPRRYKGLLALALATMVSFAAGVGSTVGYFLLYPPLGLAAVPLVEADKSPTRVRPEGLEARGTGGLTSTARADDGLSLPIQGIPDPIEITPPSGHIVVELPPALAPVTAAPAPVAAVALPPTPAAAPAAAAEGFRVQLASMRSADGAAREKDRLNRLFSHELHGVALSIEKAGAFYRVWSDVVPERAEAADLCAALAARRAQCLVVATAGAPAPVQVAAPKVETVEPAPIPIAATVPVTSSASGVRAQLASLRSLESAQRELARLTKVYGEVLDGTELTVSKIKLGERGVFYRILTAPFSDRAAADDLCHRLEANQAGCVLIPQRPRAA